MNYSKENKWQWGVTIDQKAMTKARKQVAVVPGIAYGKICDDFIRIAFTLDESKIREGMNRLVTFVEELN